MYKLQLILKYLRKRRIAWVSLVAVALCTTMCIVVISVMGGWLDTFRESFHGLSGDVIVHGESLTGFPYYEEMIERIEKLPEAKAAVPTIDTFGLINISNAIRRGVQVIGYPIDEIGKVNRFPKSLFRQKAATQPSFDPFLPPDEYRDVLPNARNPERMPGMVVGSGVLGFNKTSNADERGRIYTAWVRLTVLPLSTETANVSVEAKADQNFWIVDDSRTKVWQMDAASVYVPFDVLQRMLNMDGREEVDPSDNSKRIVPARTRDIHVAAKDGVDRQQLKVAVRRVVEDVMASHAGAFAQRSFFPEVSVVTWDELQAEYIRAIEHETILMMFLFGLISVVAVFLIFCIFYMIVVEKTRDIGIIKSLGATNMGVAGIFLGYGLAIGVVGAGLGLGLSYAIVKNINELHDQLSLRLGVTVWDPKVYAFDTIPNEMRPQATTIIVTVAILAGLLGALVPAIRAAKMHPVEALRWE